TSPCRWATVRSRPRSRRTTLRTPTACAPPPPATATACASSSSTAADGVGAAPPQGGALRAAAGNDLLPNCRWPLIRLVHGSVGIRARGRTHPGPAGRVVCLTSYRKFGLLLE